MKKIKILALGLFMSLCAVGGLFGCSINFGGSSGSGLSRRASITDEEQSKIAQVVSQNLDGEAKAQEFSKMYL